MVKTLVILGHPTFANSIANKLIVERLEKEEDVTIRNLHDLYPDMKIDVEAEQKALREADTIVMQFPFYWYSVPGILKQWQDDVLQYGFAYGSTGDALKGKRLILSFTIGGGAEMYKQGAPNLYEIDDFMKPYHALANLCQMKMEPLVFTHGCIFIPGVWGTAEGVKEKAVEHAGRLVKAINA